MAIKPVKPNEVGGVRPTPTPMPAKPGGFIPKVPGMNDDGLRRPLLKPNVRNAPAGSGLKVKAVKSNGGLGGGKNLTPAGKLAFKARGNNKPRVR